MALTPDDVVNKRFLPTKFREGYDQDEVDDFLDEVVEELRRLNDENEQLRRQLADCRAGKGGAEGTATAENTEVPAPVSATSGTAAEETRQQPVAEEVEVEETEVQAEPIAPAAASTEQSSAAPAQSASLADSGAQSGAGAEQAVSVLAMAQRMHDEHVNAGIAERDRIVAEAQQEASAMVTEAQSQARETTEAAEESKRKTLQELTEAKTRLQGQIAQLRGYENDYRDRLRSYIEGQLKDLDSSKPIGEDIPSDAEGNAQR